MTATFSSAWSSIAPALADHLWQSSLFALAAGLLTLDSANKPRPRPLLVVAGGVGKVSASVFVVDFAGQQNVVDSRRTRRHKRRLLPCRGANQPTLHAARDERDSNADDFRQACHTGCPLFLRLCGWLDSSPCCSPGWRAGARFPGKSEMRFPFMRGARSRRCSACSIRPAFESRFGCCFREPCSSLESSAC